MIDPFLICYVILKTLAAGTIALIGWSNWYLWAVTGDENVWCVVVPLFLIAVLFL